VRLLSGIKLARAFGALSLIFLLPAFAVAKEKMQIALTDISTHKIPFLVAADEGIFEKYGVPVEFYLTPHAAIKGDGDGIRPNWTLVKDPETRAPISTGGGTGLIRSVIDDGSDR